MKRALLKHYVFTCLYLLLATVLNAQAISSPGFKYQAVARTKTGTPISNQAVAVKIGLYAGSPNGLLIWEETTTTMTDSEGLFTCNIGSGVSTGNGSASSFSVIPWQSTTYYIKIAIDYNGGSTFTIMGTAQLRSVPYAFYAMSTASMEIALSDLSDIDTSVSIGGSVLKYNGSNWIPSADVTKDTVSYAINAKTAVNSITAGGATNSLLAGFSDTAVYVLHFLPNNWSVTGNVGDPGKFIGTKANEDLVFRTTAVERLRLQATGKLGIGNALPVAQLHIKGNDGVLFGGTFGSGILADSSNNTRFMWIPKKSAIRMGQITNANWNSNNIGNYSFASGYNVKASGLYSHAIGYNCSALNENCVSIGKDCSTDIVSGAISNGGSIAMGDSCIVNVTRSVAIGYKVINNSGIGLGYRVKVSGGGSAAAFGAYTNSSGINSIALGYYASNNEKQTSFVFADQSAATVTNNTAFNQFMARASGGVVFYSTVALDNGVQLFPGGGAWASVSDVNKKEHFKTEDPEAVLQKVMSLKIRTWNYKAQADHIRHIGPMAQDFYKAFKLGDDQQSICTIDIDGVNLAAIKALEKRTQALAIRIRALDIDEMKAELKKTDQFGPMNDRIQKLEQILEIHK